MFPVVESHPDNVHEDLRLDRPFPALVLHCDSINMDTMSKKVCHYKSLKHRLHDAGTCVSDMQVVYIYI